MKTILITSGLGNQMFQYAFYLANKDLIQDINLDLSWHKVINTHNGYELKRIFNIDINEESKENFYKKRTLVEKVIRKLKQKLGIEKVIYDTMIYQNYFPKTSKSFYLKGYWQSEKYFKNIEKEIIKTYKFPEIKDKNNLEILEKVKNKETVSIHVRRGDYLGHPQLDGMAPLSYYETSIEYIKKRVENPIFLIFSNDIEWCKQNLDLKNECVYYIDWNNRENSFRDMQLMSLCKHNIIPNSSFSWWGAWLNRNPKKIVIAPEKWFTDESKLPYKDIVPKEWIKIKNY